jgi:excisionase family DNA binding protein
MNADEAAEYLRLPSKGALYQLINRGHLPAYRLGGRALLFSRSELDTHIRKHKVKP